MPHHKSVIYSEASVTEPISEMAIFGERNSGTNYVEKLLRQNLPELSIPKYQNQYGWKHGFPNMLAAPNFTLAVVVVRDPQTWLQSMWKRPWHAEKSLRDLSFSEFIRSEWSTVIDELSFGLTSARDPRALRELMWDRNPETGQRFENVVKLRTGKLRAHLRLKEIIHNTLILRKEDVTPDPEGVLNFVSKTYNLKRSPTFEQVEGFRGNPDEPYIAPKYTKLSEPDYKFLLEHCDLELEKSLGYHLLA